MPLVEVTIVAGRPPEVGDVTKAEQQRAQEATGG